MYHLRSRIAVDIILFLGVLLFPWWLTSFLAVSGALYFPRFYEILIFGLMFEVLYGFEGQLPVYAILALFVFIMSLFLRSRLSFYGER